MDKMQPLISQITNIFATQSVNSIENNGLGLSLSGNQQFSGIFESLAGDNKPANFAVFNGQTLPPSYTPVSFHISQLALTTRPLETNGEFEIQGELLQADITPSVVNNVISNTSANIEYTDPTFNPNAAPIGTISFPESGKTVHEPIVESNLNPTKQTSVDPLSINDKAKSVAYTQNAPVVNSQVDKNISLSNELLGRESVANRLTPDVNKEQIQPSTLVEDNKPAQNFRSSATVSNYNIDIEKTTFTAKYSNQVASHESAQKIAAVNIDNKNLAQASIQTTNTAQSSENLPNSKLLEGAAPINSSPLNSNTMGEDEILPVKSDVLSRSNTNAIDIESDKNKHQEFRNQVINPLNSQQLNNVKDVTPPISTDIVEENTSNKPVYNVNQVSETKRNESNYRNDRSPISLQSYENISTSEKNIFINQTHQNNDSQLDLTSSLNRSQDFSTEVKTVASNNTVDNKLHANPLLSDPLASNDKTLSLDKSVSQLTSSSEVKNGDELAKQIAWARNNNASHVKIALAPEHLGALEISIDKDRDGLNIQFTTQNALAKDAIETFMPRLKDMLEQQGLNLQNANVSQQNSGGHAESYEQTAEQYSMENTQQSSQADMQTVEQNNHSSANNYLLEVFA